MTYKPDLPCSRCGKLMWRKAGQSLPLGKAMCHPCRRVDPQRATPIGRTVSREEQTQRMIEARIRLTDVNCECGLTFRAVKGRRYCDECRVARNGDRHRRKSAKRRSGGEGYRDTITGELITIIELGDRDAWTCWICSEFVNRDLAKGDPWMPSFDHVVPLSLGGLDARDNLKLAHLVCNIRRGNRTEGVTDVQVQSAEGQVGQEGHA